MKILKGLLVIAIILTSQHVCSQDTIIKTDQTEISAKVNEITDITVKYKYWNRQDGPIYSINKTDIFVIIYQDGTKEFYGKNNVNTTSNNPQTTGALTVDKDLLDNTESKEQNTTKPSVATIDPSLLNKSNKTSNNIPKKTTATIDPSLLEESKNTNKTAANKPKEDEEDSFVYREAAKFNYGFGYDAGSGNSAITLGLYAPYAFTKDRHGSFEIEVGGTAIATNGSSFGTDVSTSIYALSLSGGYGYYFIEDLKVYANLGYYYGFGSTRVNGNRTGNANINGFYYTTGIDYWLTGGFGFNVRYDAIMGPSVGIIFKNF